MDTNRAYFGARQCIFEGLPRRSSEVFACDNCGIRHKLRKEYLGSATLHEFLRCSQKVRITTCVLLTAINKGVFVSYPIIAAWSTKTYSFLCALHFLEFAIWGAWFVVLGNILDARGFTRTQIGRIYGTMGIGSIISPMFIGAIADQYFASQIVIGVLHLLGALLLLYMANVRKPAKFYWIALLYALCYAPTITMSYGIVFANLPSPENVVEMRDKNGDGVLGKDEVTASVMDKADANEDGQITVAELTESGQLKSSETHFPLIRVFGTIGWIVAGLSLKLLLKKGEPVNGTPIQLAAVLSVVLGILAFWLPNTPPAGDSAMKASFKTAIGDGEAVDKASLGTAISSSGISLESSELDSLFADSDADEDGSLSYDEYKGAMKGVTPGLFESITTLIRELPIFLSVTFICSMAMACYFAFAALFVEKSGVKSENVGPLMTVGQWIEIIFMLSLPWFLQNLGMNTVLALGCGAWFIRFLFFASAGPLPFVIFGIAIHGICFDFFFGAGAIHMENEAPTAIRNSAQSLYGVLVYGLGMFIGTELSGWLNQFCTKETTDESGATDRRTNWRTFWSIPCVILGISLACLLYALFGSSASADQPQGSSDTVESSEADEELDELPTVEGIEEETAVP